MTNISITTDNNTIKIESWNIMKDHLWLSEWYNLSLPTLQNVIFCNQSRLAINIRDQRRTYILIRKSLIYIRQNVMRIDAISRQKKTLNFHDPKTILISFSQSEMSTSSVNHNISELSRLFHASHLHKPRRHLVMGYNDVMPFDPYSLYHMARYSPLHASHSPHFMHSPTAATTSPQVLFASQPTASRDHVTWPTCSSPKGWGGSTPKEGIKP